MNLGFLGLLAASIWLLGTSACSDDGTGPTKDKGVDVAALDAGQDASAELGVGDGAGEGAVDGAPNDGTDDGTGKDAPKVSDSQGDIVLDAVAPTDGALDVFDPKGGLHGIVTSTATPVFDGKGTLYVGLYLPLIPPPLLPPQSNVMLTKVDLSKAGKSVFFQFTSNPAAGDYLLYAFLDDNGNAASPFLAPDNGDLVVAKPITVKIVAGKAGPKADLVLSTVVGGSTGGDGGVDAPKPTTGSLGGRISVTAKPVGDAKGNIHVQIFANWPPKAAPIVSTMVPNADLASPYATAKYFMGNLVPGKYYVGAFLDDNGNAAGWPFTPVVDKGDLITGAPVQVRIEAGIALVQDLVLDKVQP